MAVRPVPACILLSAVLAAAGCDGRLDGGPSGDKEQDPGDGPVVRLVDGGPPADPGGGSPTDPDGDPGDPGGTDAGTDPGTDTGGGDGGDDMEWSCETLDYLGACDGDVARWCDDGVLKERDCAAMGQRCRWIDDSTGYYCADGPGSGGGGDTGGGDTGGGDTGGGGSDPTAGCGNDVETEQLRLTNEARRSAGLPELVCDDALTRAARLHSQDMCDNGYFSHTSRDGRSFTDRLDEQGASYGAAGENIAWGQTTPESVHSSWMGSPGHRANILGSSFRRIGIGYVPCGGSPYWTQDFTD